MIAVHRTGDILRGKAGISDCFVAVNPETKKATEIINLSKIDFGYLLFMTLFIDLFLSLFCFCGRCNLLNHTNYMYKDSF